MKLNRFINVVGVHAEGEVNDVVTGGMLDVPGQSVFEKKLYFEKHLDRYRQFLLFEPRGNVSKCVNIVVAPTLNDADAGFIIIESESYPPMSGTNTICTATVLLETGMVQMQEPETHLILESPAGRIRVKAECKDGKCTQITFRNVPSFVLSEAEEIEVPGIGKVVVDVVYGGMMYAIVSAKDLGFQLTPEEADRLVQVGEAIKTVASRQLKAVHPENPEISIINQVMFCGELLTQEDGTLTSKNTVVVSPGRLDRSPCGTGTSARLALLHRRGQIKASQKFIHESIIGTRFTATIEGLTTVGNQEAVVPSITGRAWITGFHQYVLDPSDPFPQGYRLSDTWPTSRAVPTLQVKPTRS